MKLYESNMSVLQESIKNFILGYREGVAEKVTLTDILPKGWVPTEESATHSNADSQGQPTSQPQDDFSERHSAASTAATAAEQETPSTGLGKHGFFS